MRFSLALLWVGLTPLLAQNTQLAGMQQDLAELRTEVEKLKLENSDLREAVARQKAGLGQSASSAETNAKLRAETLNEVDRRLKQQTADIDRALAELTRQVNAALGKPSGAAPVRAATPAVTAVATNAAPAASDDGFPAEMPRTGTKVRVKSGDTVTKLARLHNSKAEWIIIANKLSSAAALRADVEIFIPQADAAAR
ncbi:MAG: LysM peptidoglycan-binding domain-containing protein [Verrucomicrobia bacterium]|nr:LysM peptidoglycan-binding domain-containing protein [Verrucomicrobiota bacterium]